MAAIGVVVGTTPAAYANIISDDRQKWAQWLRLPESKPVRLASASTPI